MVNVQFPEKSLKPGNTRFQEIQNSNFVRTIDIEKKLQQTFEIFERRFVREVACGNFRPHSVRW